MSELPFGVQLVASTGCSCSVWLDRHRYSPVCASMSRPPWAATVTGLSAAVGGEIPALIIAPRAPPPAAADDPAHATPAESAFCSPTEAAEVTAPQIANEVSTTLPPRMKSRREI